uniref:Uncharacterized protein n=1 Tax=Aegilops tauschii TaxID=37682 RepID=M8D123_AEGTA
MKSRNLAKVCPHASIAAPSPRTGGGGRRRLRQGPALPSPGHCGTWPRGRFVVGSAKCQLALAGAMREAGRLAGGTAPIDRAEPSTAADMDMDSGGDHAGRDLGAKWRCGGGGVNAHGVF